MVQEKKKTNKLVKFLWLFYILNSLVATTVPVEFLITNGFKHDSRITYINDGWNVVVNGEEYRDVSLDDFSFETLSYGDTLEMSTIFPKDWDYEDVVMCFHTRQAAIKMYVEDKMVYEYGHDRINAGKTVGSGPLFINLDDNYKGKNLKLKLTVSEKNALSNLDKVWISESEESYRYVITENRISLYMGLFLLVVGIVIVCVVIGSISFIQKSADILFLALFMFLIGLWQLCYHNCIIMFSLPIYTITLMEYTTLFFAPLPLIVYLKKYVNYLNKKVFNVFYNIILATEFIFVIAIMILHNYDIVHSAAVLPYFHVLLAMQVLYFYMVICYCLRRCPSKKAKILALVSLMFSFLCIGYDLIWYVINRYLGIKLPQIYAISAVGIVIFCVILIIDLWYSVNEKILEEHEKEILIHSAYTDELTNVNNRIYCTEYMSKLVSENSEYSIVCFDLNNLKKVNDLYGHSKGDLLIKKAANSISHIFGEQGIIGRMGGDEFISIIKNNNKEKIETLINSFNAYIDELNVKNDDGLKLSIALGYATSSDVEDISNIEKVYILADNHMYANKKEMKKSDA